MNEKRNEESKPHVLIVDDVPKNLQLVGTVLRQQNMKISVATDGKKALALTDRIDFDLILLDIMMPGMDGVEVCRHLRSKERTRNVPVIFLTAKTGTQSIVEALRAGGQDYVTKPFQPEELLARVDTHIELHRLRTLLETQNHELEELNHLKSRMFSLVSHDLRNYVSVLMMTSTMLKDDFGTFTPGEIKQSITSIFEVSEKLTSFFEDLIRWAKIQMGQLEHNPVDFLIGGVIERNLDLLSHNAEMKRIDLVKDIPQDVRCYADENMVNTVLRNLLTNAIKFTRPGGFVRIAAGIKDGMCVVAVIDNGVGMSPEISQNLFESDSKYIGSGTAQERGTGIGLKLSRDFVIRNGGRIWVDSALGKGSTFYFSIPLDEDSSDSISADDS